MHEIYLKKMAF